MAHQLFLPFVSEADEHVLAGTLESLGMVLDEAEETVYVRVLFKVNGQYVSHSLHYQTVIRLAGQACSS